VQAAPVKNTLEDRVRTAISHAVEFLKKSQAEGAWEPKHQFREGGTSALAILALLEAGINVDDPAIEKGLRYLRDVEPEYTYSVSLQTMAFSRAKRMKDKQLLQRNVDWLLAARCRDADGSLLGWTYTKAQSRVTDNSNTQFAVMALDAGHDAGATVLKQDWEEIRDYYLRTQQADGGWIYNAALKGPTTFTMTSAGVCGLLIARKQIKQEEERLNKAVGRGLQFLGDRFTVADPDHQYYLLYHLARLGRLANSTKLTRKAADKSYDWYKLEAEWLLDRQLRNGSWQVGQLNESSVLVTSFAVLFLASQTNPDGK
jgi:hypothetical protein